MFKKLKNRRFISFIAAAMLLAMLFTIQPSQKAEAQGKPFIPVKDLVSLFRDFTKGTKDLVRNQAEEFQFFCSEVWYGEFGGLNKAQMFENGLTCGIPVRVHLDWSTWYGHGYFMLKVVFMPLVVDGVPIGLSGVWNADGTLHSGGSGWRGAAERFALTPAQPLAEVTTDPQVLQIWLASWAAWKAANPNSDIKPEDLGLQPDGTPRQPDYGTAAYTPAELQNLAQYVPIAERVAFYEQVAPQLDINTVIAQTGGRLTQTQLLTLLAQNSNLALERDLYPDQATGEAMMNQLAASGLIDLQIPSTGTNANYNPTQVNVPAINPFYLAVAGILLLVLAGLVLRARSA